MPVIDPRQPYDEFSRLRIELESLSRRLDTLEAPTGTQAYQTVQKLTALVNNIQAQLDAYNSARYTNAQIDAKVASPGTIAPVDVNATGGGTFPSGVSSTGVYNNLLSSSYRVQYITSTGPMGYVPSSRKFKQAIATARLDASAVSMLRLVTFRYREAVEQLGSDAAVEVGLIAEEVAEIPALRWLVDWDEDGNPAGIHYERLSLALLSRLDDHESRLTRVEGTPKRV